MEWVTPATDLSLLPIGFSIVPSGSTAGLRPHIGSVQIATPRNNCRSKSQRSEREEGWRPNDRDALTETAEFHAQSPDDNESGCR